MAKARTYGWAAKRFETPKKVAELKGQAAVVRDTLDRMSNEASDAGTNDATFLAETITEQVVADGKLVTRQDPARVVLYYLLILKKRGFIRAAEQLVEVEPDETDESSEISEESAEELETVTE